MNVHAVLAAIAAYTNSSFPLGVTGLALIPIPVAVIVRLLSPSRRPDRSTQ
jgi:hypothetical protein